MNNFFTADEHHFHENARVGWGNPNKARPFESCRDMKEGLIARHNEVVRPGDNVYHIGDMFWKHCRITDAYDIMDRLNGNHFYLLGNHEEVMESDEYLRQKFGWVQTRAHIFPKGGPRAGIALDHYAGWVWDRAHHGAWQLYGHSHGGLDNDPALRKKLSVDVGVDSWNYYPVSLEQIVEVMRKKG